MKIEDLDIGDVVYAAKTIILKTAVEYIPANKNQHKLDKEN